MSKALCFGRCFAQVRSLLLSHAWRDRYSDFFEWLGLKTPERGQSVFLMDTTYMQTTLTIDEDLLKRASSLSGIEEKAALVQAGLEAWIARETGKRLAEMGGTQPKLASVPRRRSA